MTRVAVTTHDGRQAAASDAYRRKGFTPVRLPCVAIEPADDAARRQVHAAIGDADWLFVTSATTVGILWPGGSMPATPAAAVGTATARAITEAGGVVGAVGDAGGADLADRLGAGPGLVVYPRAAGADDAVTRRLIAAGWDVIDAAVYTTVPIPPAGDPVDAVAFASPSAVEGWCSARSLDGLVAAAIGSTTAAALDQLGRRADVVADRPGHTHLAAALARHLRGRITP